MNDLNKQLSNAYSTGSGGANFEIRVQTFFVVLMLTNGFAPCLPQWPIKKVKLQGKYQGFNTDDVIVYVNQQGSQLGAKLLGQIKHSISVTKSDKQFGEVINAAWKDFNNKDIFNEGKDVIALITGPLSKSDTNGVRGLLEQARSAENEKEFFSRIKLAKFTSDNQRNKLIVIKEHLCKASQNTKLTEEQIWSFLKSFHLLIYDLDIKGGTLSLLNSLIGQYSPQRSSELFARIMEEVAWQNENAGVITKESLPDDIQAEFDKPFIERREKIIKDSRFDDVDRWLPEDQRLNIALANLIGSWDERNEADKEFVSYLTGKDYLSLTSELKGVLTKPNSPMAQNNGVWMLKNRVYLWKKLSSYISDEHLNTFKNFAVSILAERDPKFDLENENRFAANIYGKVLNYSSNLREGIASSLALIGSYTTSLEHCSLEVRDSLAALTIREIFTESDWMTWGSLNLLLPFLAEADPDEFLSQIEATLTHYPYIMKKLFEEERSDIVGGENYITGLLWALETLAWNEKYLVRVSVILADLASHDPGGNWANRPINSLINIMLPWNPQTTAKIEKRKIAVETVKNEVPKVGWKLLMDLLPNKNNTSFGSRKPTFRKFISDTGNTKVTQKEYWDQVKIYSDMALNEAKMDFDKLIDLVSELGNLPENTFNELLYYLESEEITEEQEERKAKIRKGLRKQIFQFELIGSDDKDIIKLNNLFRILEPNNPLLAYQYLFDLDDWDQINLDGDYDEELDKLMKKRQQVVKEILDYGGVDAIFEFLHMVNSKSNVGLSLGFVADETIDATILPEYLNAKDLLIDQFTQGYVRNRYYNNGWDWVDELDKSNWSSIQLGKFLSFLPFITETWNRVKKLLGNSESNYWKIANVNPHIQKQNLSYAIDKLIEHERPFAAIYCLFSIIHRKGSIDTNKAIKALIKGISSREQLNDLNKHHIVEIIKHLQENPHTDQEGLMRVEWIYLGLLNGRYKGFPKLLENKLTNNPNFFCEMIRLIYKSKKQDAETETGEEITDEKMVIAEQAYRLLDKWTTPPGTQGKGGFSADELNDWLTVVKEQCSETGHLEFAFQHLGKVLSYSPKDPNGLWIHAAVAKILNGKDAENIRTGFTIQIQNSLGAHWVDPTGKPERELARKYKQQAEDVENAGYYRLATSLKELAERYNYEAERIINEHNQEEQGLDR